MEDTKSIDLCENIDDNYVKPWKHNEINQKGKMSLASFEELEYEDIAISIDGDRISDLVREGNFMYTSTNAIFYFKYFLLKCQIYIYIYVHVCIIYIYEICLIMKMNLTNSMFLFMLDMFFWHIGIQDIDRSIPYDASTIHGTRYLHNQNKNLPKCAFI